MRVVELQVRKAGGQARWSAGCGWLLHKWRRARGAGAGASQGGSGRGRCVDLSLGSTRTRPKRQQAGRKAGSRGSAYWLQVWLGVGRECEYEACRAEMDHVGGRGGSWVCCVQQGAGWPVNMQVLEHCRGKVGTLYARYGRASVSLHVRSRQAQAACKCRQSGLLGCGRWRWRWCRSAGRRCSSRSANECR